MKFKRTVLLLTVVIMMGLLLGASAAQAFEVEVDDKGTNATAIRNLEVDDVFYDVEFKYDSADNIWGEAVFDFPGAAISAIGAATAVNDALNSVPAVVTVGPNMSSSHSIPFERLPFQQLIAVTSDYDEFEPQLWWWTDVFDYDRGDVLTYANFTIVDGWCGNGTVDPGEECDDGDTVDGDGCSSNCIIEATIGGNVYGLAGSGLVLQNNGRDDETIDENGPFTFDTPLESGATYDVTVATYPANPAQICIVQNGSGQVPAEAVTDVAVICVEASDLVTIGGTVSDLVGSGLVLQNNGRDNETIDSDGEFTFDTPLIPGTFYDVTVATQPTNPAQICSVANGSGQVATTDVTDVAVTCAEPVLGDVIKVAAMGDILDDGTVLATIDSSAGVAINISGKVAFGGRDDTGTGVAFTQDGKVVEEGDTLPDGTILARFRVEGGVGINAGRSGDRVAFQGEDDNRTVTVFTQAGRVAADGDTLPDGTIWQIDDGVAINDLDEVAFHGLVDTESGPSEELLRVVFTSDGQTTRVAVREGDTLTDDNTVETIEVSGGVAINNFGDVAFHGDTVNPDAGSDSLQAVFTSAGLVAKEGDILEDDTTILDEINESGGVAINVFGDVAFHGSVVDAAPGSDSVKAVFVFNQDGSVAKLVAKEGDNLSDGTPLDEINANGGVAINFFGDVVFHGRTGGVKAVFTQNGLVAKEGDNLADGTTLKGIGDSAGVAINFFGEVAFIGTLAAVDTTWAVLVGKAPDPVPDPPGKATLISPSGTITDNTPTYTWNAVKNATRYRLWVNDSTAENVIDQSYTADSANCGDGTGECAVTPETVLADDTFEWWIQAQNDSGDGPWSDDGMFFTVDTSSE